MSTKKYTSGNKVVDAVGEIRITGNITPMAWYQELRTESGKPYLAAITILADIVYWYRPTEIRDEVTGQIVGYKKKFAADALQRTYESYAKTFGFSKRQVKEAIIFLEKKGIIEREFRHFYREGLMWTNVLYLKLNPKRLYEITFPGEEGNTGNGLGMEEEQLGSVEEKTEPVAGICETHTQEAEKQVQETSGTSDENSFPHVAKLCQVLSQKNEGVCDEIPTHAPTKNCQTNTYNTTDTSTENNPSITTERETTTESRISIHLSNTETTKDGLMDSFHKKKHVNFEEVETKVRKQISYDVLYKSCSDEDKAFVDELVSVIADVMSNTSSTMYVGKRPIPTGKVQEQFMTLNIDHIKYVIESVKNSNTTIKNIKAYLITSLYNAPLTIGIHQKSITDKKESFVGKVKKTFSNFTEREYNFNTLEQSLICMG